jgi:hypothetical protein
MDSAFVALGWIVISIGASSASAALSQRPMQSLMLNPTDLFMTSPTPGR